MKFDLGTLLALVFFVVFLIPIFLFPICKRNESFGLRQKKCFESEEIWHKIHVRASFVTIPFDISFFLVTFIESVAIKVLLTILSFFTLIFSWNMVVRYTDREYFKQKKYKEEAELRDQEKKESGWR